MNSPRERNARPAIDRIASYGLTSVLSTSPGSLRRSALSSGLAPLESDRTAYCTPGNGVGALAGDSQLISAERPSGLAGVAADGDARARS
jgi:hypothetical protein